MQLDCLSNYVAECSLLDYNMLQYAPSLTAASAVFLAKYILSPSQRPWVCGYRILFDCEFPCSLA